MRGLDVLDLTLVLSAEHETESPEVAKCHFALALEEVITINDERSGIFGPNV
jgi:hypothetical protein